MSRYFIMSQILRRNRRLDIDLLFTIEKKLCIHQHHKVNVLTYKKNNKVPKGLLLKFNLALCTDNNVLREQCNNILFNASSQIRNKIIKALGQKIISCDSPSAGKKEMICIVCVV